MTDSIQLPKGATVVFEGRDDGGPRGYAFAEALYIHRGRVIHDLNGKVREVPGGDLLATMMSILNRSRDWTFHPVGLRKLVAIGRRWQKALAKS